MQKQFTIELDETVCVWLHHISQTTGQTVENVIASGISHLVIGLEDVVFKTFIEPQD